MKAEAVSRHEVITVGRQATIAEAARTMRHYHVGNVIVVQQRQTGTIPVGILTDRDIVIEVIGQGYSPEQITVDSVMSATAMRKKTLAEAKAAHHKRINDAGAGTTPRTAYQR